MATKKEYIKIHTPEFRVSYPTVFKAKAVQPGQAEKFSIVMLFDKKIDLSAPIVNKAGKEISIGMKKAAFRLLKNAYPKQFKEFGTDLKQWREWNNGNPVLPFRDGDKDKKYSLQKGYPGTIFVRAATKDLPGLVDVKRGADGKRIPITEKDARLFYPGCFARATLSMTTYEYMGKNGVTCYLNSLMKIRDGDPLGNRADAQSEFDEADDEVEVDEDMENEEDSGDEDSEDEEESDDDGGF